MIRIELIPFHFLGIGSTRLRDTAVKPIVLLYY